MSRISIYMLVLLFIVSLGSSTFAEEQTANDPVHFPTDGNIALLKIEDPTFGITNCYLLSNARNQAILIDAAERLERVSTESILVDVQTRHSSTIPSAELTEYRSVDKDTVLDPKTKKKYFVFDQYQPVEKYRPQIINYLQEHQLTLVYIALTHGHMDHIGSAAYLAEKTGAKILMHRDDLRDTDGAPLNVDNDTLVIGYPKDAYRLTGTQALVTRVLHDGDLISVDDMVFQVIHTPGHSPGSICLWTKKGEQAILFSGDTLLHWGYRLNTQGEILLDNTGNIITDDIGRTNFIDGSGDETLLYRSIRRKLFTLPDNTIVFPAHGASTTVGEEKLYSQARFVPLNDTIEVPKKTEGVTDTVTP